MGATALQYTTHLLTCSALLPGSDRQPCTQHWQMISVDHHSGLSQGVVIKGYGAYSISATTVVRLQPACNRSRSRSASVKFTIDVSRRNHGGRSSFHGLETVHRVTTTETSIRVEGIVFPLPWRPGENHHYTKKWIQSGCQQQEQSFAV